MIRANLEFGLWKSNKRPNTCRGCPQRCDTVQHIHEPPATHCKTSHLVAFFLIFLTQCLNIPQPYPVLVAKQLGFNLPQFNPLTADLDLTNPSKRPESFFRKVRTIEKERIKKMEREQTRLIYRCAAHVCTRACNCRISCYAHDDTKCAYNIF